MDVEVDVVMEVEEREVMREVTVAVTVTAAMMK